MQFQYRFCSNIFFGEGAVSANAESWLLGRRAYILSGASSGRKSGALLDVEAVLKSHNISYETFEGIGNNPDVEQCIELSQSVVSFGADFIIAIGGGSPMDAAKAVAAFACNEGLTVQRLFKNDFESVLPIVAIPTTSGTGSEVTPWSVLTRRDLNSKFSFGNEKTLPAVALLDPNYTKSLPRNVVLHTAMDACTHLIEGIISIKNTPITDALAVEGLRRFGLLLPALEKDDMEKIRSDLMLASMLGGVVIAKTGTTIMHGMGYPLTYYHNYSHGEANCAVLPGYLRFVERAAPERLKIVYDALGLNMEGLCGFVERNFKFELKLSGQEIEHYAKQTMQQGSTRNMPVEITQEILAQLYEQSFVGAKA
ncbi:iron-containing alcohol dehydrogenase [Eubacteriales bacterium OttesenSCG-928-K08]|nr:iron-containing alcohol dehydrogenase [Eubacteriales bacterium OttesenSCG-928-K08]